MLNEFFSNKVIITCAIAWLTAQILKTITHAVVYKKIDLKRLIGDGGMPSCHSAVVSACALSCGLLEGFDSSVFALALVTAIIVMHDASGVRLETGKQAVVIKDISQILEEISNIHIDDEKLKEFVGHTHLQVFMGAITGIVIAIICFNVL